MSDVVSRVHGPPSERPRYTWNPRLSSSDPVRHPSSTAASAATASNAISFTAVVPLASSAPMSQGAWRTCPSMSSKTARGVGGEIGPLVLRVDIDRI